MKKVNNSYVLLESFLLLLCFIFSGKELYITRGLIISMNIILYPLTFLITGLVIKKYKSKEAKVNIRQSVLILLIFYLLCTIFCSINSTLDSKVISSALRGVFTPNKLALSNLIIYYPDLIKLFAMLAIYYLTHNIFIVIFDVCKDHTSDFMSFYLAILISLIIDQMLFFSIINIGNLLNYSLSIVSFIRNLTSIFIIIIFSTVILSFVFHFITNKNK